MMAAVKHEGLGVVRGRACLRQRAAAPGADRHRDCYRNARLRRGRLAILALAHDDADSAIGLFPTGRHGQLRRQAEAAEGIRPAAAGGHRDDLGLPCGLARGRRSRMEGWSGARLRLVPRRQRSVDAAGRSGNRQLPGRAAPRPAEREQRRRIGGVLSAQPRGNPSACPHQRRRANLAPFPALRAQTS